MKVVECILMRGESRWLHGVMEGWKVGDAYFVGAICLGGGAQLDLDESYDGSAKRIQAMQYETPNRKFPVDECINPWQAVRIDDDKSIGRFATLEIAMAWAKGAWLWTRVRS